MERTKPPKHKHIVSRKSNKDRKEHILADINKIKNNFEYYKDRTKLTFYVFNSKITIPNNLDALNNFENLVMNKFPIKQKSKSNRLSKPIRPSISNKRIHEAEYYNEFTPHKVTKSEIIIKPNKTKNNGFWDEKNRYYSNGNYLIKLDNKPTGVLLESYDFSDIINKEEIYPQEAKIVGELSFNEDNTQVPSDEVYAHVQIRYSVEKKTVDLFYPINQIDAIMTKYKNSEPVVDQRGVLHFIDNNEIVGAVMPLSDLELSEHHLKRYKEIYGEDL